SGNFITNYGQRGVFSGMHMEVTVGGPSCSNNYSFIRMGNDGSGWSQIAKFGNVDTNGDYKVYVENNYVKNVLEAVDVMDGTRLVFRFNTFSNSAVIHHGADTQMYGGRYSENINNTFINDSAAYCGGYDINRNGIIGI